MCIRLFGVPYDLEHMNGIVLCAVVALHLHRDVDRRELFCVRVSFVNDLFQCLHICQCEMHHLNDKTVSCFSVVQQLRVLV